MNEMQRLLTDSLDIWSTAETEKKSGRGRASGNASSVYGIRKLRELILELAVRGKLVPQDANDEPASELLKRIQAEKTRLVAEGKIKKDKPLAAIAEEEKPFSLPHGWAYSRLGDAVEIIRGITFPGSEKSKVPEKGRVACLRTANVQDQIEWDDLLYIGEEFISREDQILMPRDIVMSMANSRELVGKVALVGEEIHQKTSFGGFLGVLRPFLIEPRFVMALLRTPHTREELIDSASQTTNIANISLAKLRPLFFAIPPLAEQHRIVAKVDELMALCDQLETRHSNAADAHEKLVSRLLATLTQSQSAEDFSANWQRIAAHFDTLFSTEASIDALKQTLLQLAVMGKLVPQDPNDEPASQLLKRIQAEKAKLIAEAKIKKDKPLAAITDDEKPFLIPKEWEWCRIGMLASLMSGKGFNASEYSNEGARLFQIANVSLGYTKWEIENFLPTEYLDLHSDLVLKDGDVLVALNRPLLNGLMKVCIISRKDLPAILYQRVGKFVFYGDAVNTRYFYFFLQSGLFIEHLQEQLQGSDQPFINQSQLIRFCCPLPPLAEQTRIVAKVDELMALCDRLKSRITDASQLQQKLADVLVAQAVA